MMSANGLSPFDLQELRRIPYFVSNYEDALVKIVMDKVLREVQKERRRRQEELQANRTDELDTLFERLYEDNASGKISDERFGKMSKKYEQEQGDIGKRLKVLRAELKKNTSRQYTADSFLEVVCRYTNAEELTQRMVTEPIDHIDVYHAKQVDGLKTQEVKIFYNCIGAFEVPDRESIPALVVYMATRKGVALSYSNTRQVG